MTAPGRPATAMAVTAACFLLVTLVSSCGSDSDTPIPDEAKRAGRGWETLKAANEDYYADMDRGMSRHPDQVFAALPFLKTPEQAVDTFVKGRNNWIVWTAGNDRSGTTCRANVRRARLPEDAVDARHASAMAATRAIRPLEVFRAGQRAVFRSGDRPGLRTRFGLWLDHRRSGPDCPPDPFEDDTEISRRRIGARGQNLTCRPTRSSSGGRTAAGRFLLRLRDRRGGAAAVSESRFRRGGGGEVGSGALLQGPQLLRTTKTWCGRIASACRAASATSGRARSIRRPIPRTRSGRT